MAEQRYFDPQGLAAVSRMELVARQVVDGFLTGLHPSPYHGSSVEYADHRPYTIGDEIRTIDWKLLAKTDKHYVKLYEDQTNMRGMILVDASRSMTFCSEQATLSKFDYACHLAAALSYLMLRQNDAVGFALLDHEVRSYLPPRSTPSYFRHMIQVMEDTRPTRETSLGPLLHQVAGRLKSRGIVILISDLLDDIDAVTDGLAHFRHDRHDVIVFHLIDPAEVEFPYERLTRFRDIEGGSQLVTNPRTVKKKYLERLRQFLETCRINCLERRVSYELVRTDQPYERMLSAYLEKRKR